MCKHKLKYFALLLLVNIAFTTGGFATKKDTKNLAKINKEIAENKKNTTRIEKESKKIQTELKKTQNKMVKIANNVKKYEKQLSLYDKQLAGLRVKENLLNKKIELNNQELIKIIAIFENIAMVPRGYLIISPSKINTIFQTSVLLTSVVEELKKSRVIFAQDLQDLINLKDDITLAKNSITSLNNKVKKEKNKISSLIKSKQSSYKKLTSQTAKNKKDLKKLVKESKTIEELLKKAEKLRKQKIKKRNLAGIITKSTVTRLATGNNPLPIDGSIKTYFGDKKIGGVKSKGLYIKPRAGSQVISPTDADVIFSGAFYGYDNLLILHNSDNYYIIMGGMKDVYPDEGQTLLAGEPVGEMGEKEFYIELRENEKPINPLKYFKI